VIHVVEKVTSFVVKEVVFDRFISVVWNLLSRLMKYQKRVGSVKLVELKLYVPSHRLMSSDCD